MGRGKLIIFNFSTFEDDSKKLPGAKEEIKNLQNTFKQFNASVDEVYENLDKNEVESVLETLAKSDFEEYSYFVLTISSHGGRAGTINTSDCKEINIYDHIMSPLICNPKLNNKPKLFIVNTCKSGFDAQHISGTSSSKANGVPKNTIICYAASEMGKAYGNIFTDSFCSLIKKFGCSKSVQEIMQLTIADVREKTNNLQTPISEDYMEEKFELGKFS